MHKLNKKQLASQTLQPRYFSAIQAEIPVVRSKKVIGQHYPIPLVQSITADTRSSKENGGEGGSKHEIDGFYLLETSGISFPEDLQQITLNDKKLQSVVDEDLTYFTELMYMDVSENFLPLFPFGALPKLRELRIACNHINVLEDLYGFNELMYLDISYNQLQVSSVTQLSVLPLLKELDISGNNLSLLPPDLSAFENLEKLVAQYNKFDNNRLFHAFASIPNLRYLDVSNNFFSDFPIECVDEGFRLLDTLDISFNYFSTETNLDGIILLRRLEVLLLYGNPVLGPTGEDPMYIYLEDTVDKANAHRDSIQSTISYIDFVTEIPRRRVLKKGQPLGRLALYRDFSIVQVDGRLSTLSNREWRKKGIQTIFTEMMANRRGTGLASSTSAAQLQASSSAPAFIPDYTFLTNSIATGNLSKSITGGIQANAMTLKEADRDAIADDVMRRVVAEMGLTGDADLEAFATAATLPPTAIQLEMQRALLAAAQAAADAEEGGEEDIHGTGHNNNLNRAISLANLNFDSFRLLSKAPSQASSQVSSQVSFQPRELQQHQAQQPLPPADHLPTNLFTSSNIVQAVPNSISSTAQPVALKTAMKALQRALDQPLTNYDAVPSRWSTNENAFEKHTTTSKLRQLPRIPLSSTLEGAEESRSQAATKHHHYGAEGHGGLAEPAQLKKIREENREKTLTQIEHVLAALNESTQRITDTAAQQREMQKKDEEIHGSTVATVKQSMDRMRYFAKPQPGIKNLKDIMRDVADEFNFDD
jgi:hypothetical protein